MFVTSLLALVLLHGTVTMGPTMPVCKVGTPCSKAAAHVTLTFSRPGRVERVVTDARGRYRVSLPAGAWNVRASVGMSLKPTRIELSPSSTATRDFAIDTGIR